MGSWRSARLVLPIAGMAFLWLLSSIPVAADQTMVGVFIPKLLQKSMHVVAYASLTVAWLWALGFERHATLWAVALITTYAAVDEIHQTFVPGRYGTPRDVLLDLCGAMLGIFVMRRLRRGGENGNDRVMGNGNGNG